MIYLLVFFSSLILTIFFTPFLIEYLKKLDIVDRPNERKIHKNLTPRMGGIIIYAITIVAITAYYRDLNHIRLLVLSSMVIVSTGIFDDTIGVKWSNKFILQFFAVLGVIYFLAPSFETVSLFGLDIPQPFSYILLFIFILGVINSVNLLDGMDGLVSGFSLLVSMVLLFMAFGTGNALLLIITASLVGSILGFLKYNAFPARVFLGDTGSLMLGFFLVVSSLMITLDYSPANLDLTFSLILFGVPIVDTLKVMAVRIFDGKSPFLPDKRHIHHVIMGNRVRHKTTVFIIQIFAVLFVLTAIYYIHVEHFSALLLFVLLAVSLASVKYIIKAYNGRDKIESWRREFVEISFVSTKIYKNYFIPVSALIIAVLLLVIFPRETKIDNSLIMFSFLSLFLLLIVSLYNSFKTKTKNEIYVLINILMFVVFSNVSSSQLSEFFINSVTAGNIIRISTLLLLAIIISYMVFRDKFFPNKMSLLSGMDLIIMVLISMTAVIQEILGSHYMNFIGTNLIIGFVVYLWYKIFMNFYKQTSDYVYYASFALPLIALAVLYIN